jgi:predicted anti-sigma-YlaC factor YlaD
MAELSTEYLEGKLSFWQKANYYLHWMMCPPCRAYREQVKQTTLAIHLAQQAEDATQDPPGPPANLLEQFRVASQDGKES